jgi:hypothetical protein
MTAFSDSGARYGSCADFAVEHLSRAAIITLR